MSTWIEAHHFLMNMNVGDFYQISTTDKVLCTKKTDKVVELSNGVSVRKRFLDDGSFYLDSKKVKVGNRQYSKVEQVLRDIEGFLIFKKLTE